MKLRLTKRRHFASRSHCASGRRRPRLESLESRCLLASDFGDALASYGIAEHQNVSTDLSLGADVDTEAASQFSAVATGDDALGLDDDDGVTFASNVVQQGQLDAEATVSVTNLTGSDARLDAWIDFDGDGTFEASEKIFAGPVGAGVTDLTISYDVPATAAVGLTLARFRLSDADSALGPTGVAAAGEVEDHTLFIVGANSSTELSDFGDAAASFGVAEHQNIAADFTLGDSIDAEVASQFSATAVGDDVLQLDDDDGVEFTSTVVRQGQLDAEVVVSVNNLNGSDARLDAWIDFDGDGTFEASERIYGDSVAAGASEVVITYDVSASAAVGVRAARFRLSDSEVALGPTGVALSGEVEDHAIIIVDDQAPEGLADYGDAPASYGAARHNNVAVDLSLGALVDVEGASAFSATATGDDLAGVDDEDGVVFAAPSVQQGQQDAEVVVTVNNLSGADARLDAWIDFDGDGAFESGERIFGASVAAGVSVLTISYDVPQDADLGVTFARFRLSDAEGAIGPLTVAAAGEVEDHAILILEGEEPLSDFSDAPASYGIAEHRGASHDLAIGVLADGEESAQTSANALGDDIDGFDDEEGVIVVGALNAGQQDASIVVHVSNLDEGVDARLDAWIDFDGDGAFEASERIFGGAVDEGHSVMTITFDVPANADLGRTFARFRLSDSTTALGPTGVAAAGEVEDHLVYIVDLDGPPVFEDEGDIIVIGTELNNVIIFYPFFKEGRVIVKANGRFALRNIGADGQLVVFAGAGNDTVANFTGYSANFHGGDGNDRLVGGFGDDQLYGDAGRDLINGNFGDDELYGGADADLLIGESGDDLLVGEGGADIMFGGRDNDRMFGGDGRDLMEGGTGDDIMVGGLGDDRLTDIGGNNILIGGDGRDFLQSSGGRDILIGGETAFDADLNATALMAIMAEFSSDSRYRVRVRNIIDNSGNGAGLNVPFFLSAQTVFDDRDADSLQAGGGLDFFPSGEAVDASLEERIDMNSNF